MSRKNKGLRNNNKKKGNDGVGTKLKRYLRDGILAVMRENPEKFFNYKQLSGIFDIDDTETRQLVLVVLNELVRDEILESPERGKYKYKGSLAALQGVLQVTSRGDGFVRTAADTGDVFVPGHKLKDALDGDTVEIAVRPGRKKEPGKNLEGEIISVLKRAREQYVGVLHFKQNMYLVKPDNQKIQVEFIIARNKLMNAQDGQKVIVKMLQWNQNESYADGEITDVLGEPGLHEVEMNAIIAEYGLPIKFPTEVDDFASAIPLEIPKEEYNNRRDFRNTPTFTIDPDDAKDFDDALSFKTLENGLFEIGIHIADVSYYVKPGNPVDKEATHRATSVYLVDRVIPMLPEILSNKVCSLRPNEEKLCFSAVFTVDENANIHEEWFGRTVIYSNRRFTYNEAQKVIETGEGDMNVAIVTLNKMAVILRKRRLEAGALEIESSEIKFRLDEKGNPVEVFKKELKEANKLIEEFMLLANRRVSEFIGKPDGKKVVRPSVYRIHDRPSVEKLQSLTAFLDSFGYRLKNISPENASELLNAFMKQIKGKPEEQTLRTMIIRSMPKAVYSTQNIGHYGLAFEFYSHFTSPIRRYPDLMLHRILDDKIKEKPKSNENELEKQCVHSSNMEKNAAEAERASIKYKQVQFLEKHVGEAFEAIITSVVNWGLYVEIKSNFCEGLVSISNLDDDHYSYDAKKFAITGRKTGKSYKIGDTIDVIINKVDILNKEVDLVLANQF
jgi:ribonuclease R